MIFGCRFAWRFNSAHLHINKYPRKGIFILLSDKCGEGG